MTALVGDGADGVGINLRESQRDNLRVTDGRTCDCHFTAIHDNRDLVGLLPPSRVEHGPIRKMNRLVGSYILILS